MGSNKTTLGELVKLVRGNTYKSKLLSETEGPVLLGLGSIQRNGGFKYGAWKHYPGESDARILLHPGDIYVSLKDLTQACDLLGAVSRVPEDIPEGRLTQDTVKLDFYDTNELEKQYVYWSLRTPQYRAYCKARGTGTTNMSLSRDDFLAWRIPERCERNNALIALFEDIEAKVRNKQQTNDYLAAMCDAVFSEQFGAIEENAVLSDIAQITMGQSPSGKSYNEDGVGTVFYQGRGEFGWRFPTQRLFTTEPKRMATEGDVLMSVRAPVGDLNVAYEDCCIGRGLAAIHSQYPSYCLYLMRSLDRKLDAFNGEGTVFGSINGKALNGLEIALPETDAIEAFEAFAQPIDQQIRTNVAEERNLAALRDTLLPKLMSGEIDVSQVVLPAQPNNHLPMECNRL